MISALFPRTFCGERVPIHFSVGRFCENGFSRFGPRFILIQFQTQMSLFCFFSFLFSTNIIVHSFSFDIVDIGMFTSLGVTNF